MQFNNDEVIRIFGDAPYNSKWGRKEYTQLISLRDMQILYDYIGELEAMLIKQSDNN